MGVIHIQFLQKDHYGKIKETILVKASYGEGNVAEVEFSYTPKSEAVTTTNFDVDAGSHGTFDVEYSIKGGSVKIL